MHGSVAAGGPAIAHTHVGGVVDVADIDQLAGSNALAGQLRVAP